MSILTNAENALHAYDEGFAEGHAAGMREAAEIAENKGGEYEKLGDYGINQGFVRKVEAANGIAAAILAKLPAK